MLFLNCADTAPTVENITIANEMRVLKAVWKKWALNELKDTYFHWGKRKTKKFEKEKCGASKIKTPYWWWIYSGTKAQWDD